MHNKLIPLSSTRMDDNMCLNKKNFFKTFKNKRGLQYQIHTIYQQYYSMFYLVFRYDHIIIKSFTRFSNVFPTLLYIYQI